MLTNVKYSLPDGFDEKQFLGELTEHYAIRKAPTVFRGITFYDTFDWRLFNKSFVLYASGKKLFLRKLAKSEFLFSADITPLPVFIWEFPESELKQRLAPIIKMRALLKLVELHTRSTPYRILDRNEKTVAGLAYEEIRPSRNKNTPALTTYLWLRPVKGYPKYARSLSKHFQAAGLIINNKEDFFFKALEIVDKKPGSYSAKVNIQLDPDMRSDEATKVILQFLLNVMRINTANIEKDFDTEILHDFRVAIRRTRSALGQIKNVFPARTTNRFKKDFALVGKLSNELRDLDVYLLKEATYKAMLPPALHDDIDPLFNHLRKKRSKAIQHVIRGLKSKKYSKTIQDWEVFLNKPAQDSVTALNAESPVLDLACKRIYKKYRGVVKAGSLILENTEDEMLHALRIECKKLRYLLEFFSSLYTRKKIGVLIEQLKKLQDNLGDFNDLCIQADYLLDIAQDLPTTRRQSKSTLVAVGSLIGTLDRERQRVKDAFAKTFTDFASPANQALFQELFGTMQKNHN
jgi:CHAD domain-containing protein